MDETISTDVPHEDLSVLQAQVREFLKATNEGGDHNEYEEDDNNEEEIIDDTDTYNNNHIVDNTALSGDEEEQANNSLNNEVDSAVVPNQSIDVNMPGTRTLKRTRRKFVIPGNQDDQQYNISKHNPSIISSPSGASAGNSPTPTKSPNPYPVSPSISPNQSLSPSYIKSAPSPSYGHSNLNSILYSPNSHSDQAPPTLGKFQLLHHIGNGYFGNTFSAASPDSSEYVAIKLIDLNRISQSHQTVLRQEFEILRAISANNQSVVNYQSLIVDHHHLGIVQEFVENGSLSDIYKRLGAFPESLLVKYVTQILESLQYIHQQQLTHRNLKANNVLLAKGGRCKLSDFGMGCALGASFRSLTGEPYWTAPEVLMMRDISPKSDIWSLGCLIVELLTGSPPFGNYSPMEALVHIMDDRKPVDLPEASPELQSFLHLCFVRNAAARSSVDQLLKHPWLGFTGHQDAVAFSALLNQPPMKFQNNSRESAGKPRSENFSIDFLSQMESNEHDISQLNPVPCKTFDTSKLTWKHYSTPGAVDKSSPPAKQIEQLQQIIDHNQEQTRHLKDAMEQLEREQTNRYQLQVQMKSKLQEILDQNKTGARISAHSNMLLKRTNQMASELTRKNEYFRLNIKRLEDYLLTKDDCAKKLANVVYKHKISFDNLLNPTLAAPVTYQIGSKLWKKGQEKKALGTLKDNFLFFFKNDKSKEPLDVVYLNDKKSISVSSSQDSTKKKTFYICIGTLITSGEHDVQSGESGSGNSTSSSSGSPSPSSSVNSSSKDMSAAMPTLLWCLLGFDNQKDMEAWLGVLEASISWYERKPNEISKPILEKKHTKQKSVDRAKEESMSTSWKKESGGMKFPGVFGIKLDDVMARENPNAEIPSFVTKMVNFLERHIQEEGILRISGSSTEIQEMKATLNKGENIEYPQSRDTHAVAGLLKLYLRELPDLLVPTSLRIVSAEIIADRSMSEEEKIASVIELFKQIPKNEHNLLKHMIRFAKRVTEQSDHNKMVLANVTTCFAQSLKGLIPGLFTFCVQHYEQIFVNIPPTSPTK